MVHAHYISKIIVFCIRNMLKKTAFKKNLVAVFYYIFLMGEMFTTVLSWQHDQKIIYCEPRRKHKHYFSLLQHVRDSLNGEAKVITPAQVYSVDGYHAASNTVYEYNACIFYGCKKCYPKQGNLKRFCHPDWTVDEVYEATLKKTAILRDAGYNVIETWGCDFAKQKEADPELAEFLETFKFVPPLEPRDAFFGGRTGAATLYTSIYPAINK